MAVSTKAQVKKLLASKNFTGKQAAHLVLKDSVEVDHGRPGILTATEIQRLKQNLQGREAAIYNSWIRTYPLVDYSAKEAIIMALEAQRRLLGLHGPIALALMGELELQQRDTMPFLVTQKQLEDIQREHQQKATDSLEAFTSVVENTASDLLEKEAENYPEANTEIEDLLRITPKSTEEVQGITPKEARAIQAKIFKASGLRLLKDIEAGKLTPFTITKAELSKRDRLITQDGEDSQQLVAYEAEVSLKAFQKATPEKTAALVERIRTALEDGSFTFHKTPAWIDAVFFRGQNLIEAGVAYYVQWAENFHMNADSSSGYALVLNPRSWNVDKNGHYEQPTGILARGATKQDAVEHLDKNAKDIQEAAVKAHALARKQIRHVLGYMEVIEAVSDAIGVDFTEDIRNVWNALKKALEHHHRLLQNASHFYRLEGLGKLKIDIEALKPSKQMANYIRERMAMNLGADWWTEVATALNEELATEHA